MGWFSDIGEGMKKSFTSLPTRFILFVKIVFLLSFCAYVVAILGEGTYSIVKRSLPVTADDVSAAERKVEFAKRLAEAAEAPTLISNRTQAQREIEQANVEAHRISLGLKVKPEVSGAGGLAALVEVATTNLFTIVTLMFLFYLLPTFSSTGKPWRLSLNIAGIVVLSGLFALMKEITSETTTQIKYSEVFVTVSSSSVGLYLMLFGTVLAGFSLYMLREHTKGSSGKGNSSAACN
jgi:hypothetical protein